MITKEITEEMQQRVNDLARQKNILAGLERQIDGAMERTQSRPDGRTPKETANTKPKGKKRKANPEYDIQAAFVKKMEEHHPDVMVFSDTAAHIRKTMFQQIRANKLQSKISKDWPDVFVAQPSGIYSGLFLEFKAESPHLVSNPCALKKSAHLENQYQTMKRLGKRGYQWAFVWTVEMAMELTEKYLNL